MCVFCGSSTGTEVAYLDAAEELGSLLAGAGIGLVYGGGSVGLMGAVADACLAAGGDVTGVIPAGLFRKEIGHTGLTQLVEVASMHERKQLMYELADGFVALPGGLGTLEELAEVLTWNQLGILRQAGGDPRRRRLLGRAGALAHRRRRGRVRARRARGVAARGARATGRARRARRRRGAPPPQVAGPRRDLIVTRSTCDGTRRGGV